MSSEAILQAIAGTIGGTASYALLYPLDIIRTRMQVQNSSSAVTKLLNTDPEFKNGFECLVHILKNEDWKSLYKGISAGVFGVAISNAIYFWWYSILKTLAGNIMGRSVLSPGVNMLVATIAGVINITLTAPIWVVNTRMMLQKNKSPSIQEKVKNQVNNAISTATASVTSVAGHTSEAATKTVDNLSSGVNSTINTISSAIDDNLAKVDTTSSDKSPLASIKDSEGAKIAKDSVSKLQGCISSTISAIKKKTSAMLVTDGDDHYYNGIFDALVKIGKTEGISGLYRGFIPSLILTLNPAVQFAAYDQICGWIARMRAVKKGIPVSKVSLSLWEYFLLGAFAKALATIFTYPYQVIKARQQASDSSNDLSMIDVACGMFNKEGPGSFLRGIGPKLMQTCLAAAITFATYEHILVLVRRVAGR